MFDLSGRLALVTGSSRGIGFSLARGLARAGAEVVLNARDAEALAAAAEEMRREGLRAHTRVFDVTVPEQVDAAIEEIEAGIGSIDILVNNVGTQHRAPLEEFPLEAWKRLLDTNLTAVFLVGQAVGRRMIKRRHGKIINILSMQSELARPGIAPYAATKGGVKMLTRSMCAEWARYGIQVNGIGPGYFVTPLTQVLKDDPAFDAWLCGRTPAGRWGDVEELVGAAVFLSSSASDYVNGQIIYVDGGLLAVI
ncbi:MAG: SDR family oxidoreductase [Candidatus Limnocylindrales bacterium]